MKTGIQQPKVFAACSVLAVVVTLAFAYAISVTSDSQTAEGPPGLESISPAEQELAKKAILGSPQAKEVLKGRAFTFENPLPAERHGARIGTAIHIRLDVPATLKTNWLFPRCLMTRQVEQLITWTSVQLIGVVVDSHGSLIEFGPFPDPMASEGYRGPFADASEAADAATFIRELPSGRILWTSSPGHGLDEARDFMRCPPGLNDD